uniref:Uncharacterized protein n=1 Tax=Helianthus annuus TaxID=4232 RepID=A0A251TV38_HELAN
MFELNVCLVNVVCKITDLILRIWANRSSFSPSSLSNPPPPHSTHHTTSSTLFPPSAAPVLIPIKKEGRFLKKSRKTKKCGRDCLKNHHQANNSGFLSSLSWAIFLIHHETLIFFEIHLYNRSG